MFNQLIRFNQRDFADSAIKLFISFILLITLGPIKIDIENEMPVTLQSLIVLLVAVFWGWRTGTLAVVLYIIAGGIGMKVFAGYESGWERITGQFGGFFFGFVAATVIVGYIAEQKFSRKPVQCLAMWLIGHAVILGMGALWLRSLNPESWWNMIEVALPGAGIKSAVGFLITRLFIRALVPREERFTNG